MNSRRSAGFGLVESLVAAFLGVVLSSALVMSYLAAKRHYVHTMQLSLLQENGRFALRLLGSELAMAGFYGAALDLEVLVPEAVGVDCGVGNWVLDSTAPLDFVDNHSTGTPQGVQGNLYTCVDAGAVRAGTDLLAVKRSAGAASVRHGALTPGAGVGDSETWFLRDRAGSDLRWLRLQPRRLREPAMADPQLSLWRAVAKVFFIRSYSVTPGDKLPSLCVEMLVADSMSARCIVEGVEDMQFEFGVDTNGDGVANRYVADATAADVRRAVTVRIHLLLRAHHPVPGHRDERIYHLAQREHGPHGDAYPRRLLKTTVRLRNLAPPRAV